MMVPAESTKKQTKTTRRAMMRRRTPSSSSTSLFNFIFLLVSIVFSLLLISTPTQSPATSTTSLLDISYVYGFSLTSSLPSSSSPPQTQNQKSSEKKVGSSKKVDKPQIQTHTLTNEKEEDNESEQDLEQSFLSYITFVDNDDDDDGKDADRGDLYNVASDYDSNAWPSIHRFSFEEEEGGNGQEILSTRTKTETKTPTETTLDDHIHRAYRDWCFYYNKASNPKGLAAFKCNFQAVQEFHERTGQPLLMNEYADLTELEYRQLTSARSYKNYHKVKQQQHQQQQSHQQKHHPKTYSQMIHGREDVGNFAVFENTLSGDFNPYTGSSSSSSSSSSPQSSQPRRMNNPWLSPPSPSPLSEARVSPPPPRRRKQRARTNNGSTKSVRTRSVELLADDDDDRRLQLSDNLLDTRHKVKNIERSVLDMIDVNIQNSQMIESLASNQMMMVEMISSLQRDMIQLQKHLEESRHENEMLKDRLNMSSTTIVEPTTTRTHNKEQDQSNRPGVKESIAPTITMQPTSSETVAPNDETGDSEQRSSPEPSSESHSHSQSVKILNGTTKSRATKTGESCCCSSSSTCASTTTTTTMTPTNPKEDNNTSSTENITSSSLLSLNPIDVMYKPHADGFTRCDDEQEEVTTTNGTLTVGP